MTPATILARMIMTMTMPIIVSLLYRLSLACIGSICGCAVLLPNVLVYPWVMAASSGKRMIRFPLELARGIQIFVAGVFAFGGLVGLFTGSSHVLKLGFSIQAALMVPSILQYCMYEMQAFQKKVTPAVTSMNQGRKKVVPKAVQKIKRCGSNHQLSRCFD